MKILDCESIESTYKSLETILGVRKVDLCHLFDSINVYEPSGQKTHDIQDPIDHLFYYIRQEIPCKVNFDATCWFHCTRTWPNNTFDIGLLPLDQVIDKIWNYLFELTKGQVTSQQWAGFKHSIEYSNSHWADLYRMKLANPKLHGGPHALFIREAAIETAKPSTYWNYFEIPEIVDDICKHCIDKHGVDLKAKYIANTAPCIVKFIDYASDTYTLRMALIYAYLTHRNLDLLPDCNLCFSGKGIPVTKDRILKVEFPSVADTV